MQRSAERSDDARDRILDVATRHFAEHGFDGASVGRVAADAHVSKALVFFHFTSKEGLFAAVRARFVGACVDELLTTGLASRVPHEQVPELLRAFGRFIARNPDFVRLFLARFLRSESALEEESRELRSLLLQFRARLEELLRDGAADGSFAPDPDPALLSHAILAGLEGIVVQLRADPAIAERTEELFAAYADLVLHGLVRRP